MDIADQSQTPGIRHFFDVVRRRKWVLLQVLLLIPLLAVFLSLRQPKLYQASADVLVGQQVLGAGSYYTDARLLQTQAEIARTPLVARNTLRAAGVPDRSPGQFLAS